MNGSERKRPMIDIIIEQTADFFRPIVAQIEQRPNREKNPYRDYLGVLSIVPDLQMRQIIALGLIKAGANPMGVKMSMDFIENISLN